MDLSCENKTRLVEFKNGSLIVTLISCKKCEKCKPKPIEVVDLVESDAESDTDYCQAQPQPNLNFNFNWVEMVYIST